MSSLDGIRRAQRAVLASQERIARLCDSAVEALDDHGVAYETGEDGKPCECRPCCLTREIEAEVRVHRAAVAMLRAIESPHGSGAPSPEDLARWQEEGRAFDVLVKRGPRGGA